MGFRDPKKEKWTRNNAYDAGRGGQDHQRFSNVTRPGCQPLNPALHFCKGPSQTPRQNQAEIHMHYGNFPHATGPQKKNHEHGRFRRLAPRRARAAKSVDSMTGHWVQRKAEMEKLTLNNFDDDAGPIGQHQKHH